MQRAALNVVELVEKNVLPRAAERLRIRTHGQQTVGQHLRLFGAHERVFRAAARELPEGKRAVAAAGVVLHLAFPRGQTIPQGRDRVKIRVGRAVAHVVLLGKQRFDFV